MFRKSLVIISLLVISFMTMAKGRRVLFIGDSITDGAWGNSKVWNATSDERNQHDMNHIYGHGYMMIAAARYEALYPAQGWTFWNRGISGNTLNDLASRWHKDVLDLHPDVVSILIGTNDVDQALSKGETIDVKAWGAQYRSLLDAVLKQNPEARFVLCTPFVAQAGSVGQRDDFSTRQQMIASLVTVINDISQDYPATLVPFDTLVASTIAATPYLPTTYWIWDGIHPTPAMHYRMAEMWTEMVRLEY